MEEVSKKTRAEVIIKLGRLINDSFSSNITEPLVIELVKLLDPSNAIFSMEHYRRHMNE